MQASDAGKLHEFESENDNLKKFLAEPHLDIHACIWRNVLAAQVKRDAIGKMIDQFQLSERHAYRLAGLSRDGFLNPPMSQ
jgi:hypothetical protein